MGTLDKLTLTETLKAKGYNPVRLRRRKLAASLQDQIGLLQAEAEGGSYSRTVRKRVRDLETDAVVETEQQRRVSPWWWTDDNGTTNLAVRYGSTVLKLKGGKTTVVLKAHDELLGVLTSLRGEVLAGRFDEALAEAASELRDRFETDDT
jgi:hypothetical protein